MYRPVAIHGILCIKATERQLPYVITVLPATRHKVHRRMYADCKRMGCFADPPTTERRLSDSGNRDWDWTLRTDNCQTTRHRPDNNSSATPSRKKTIKMKRRRIALSCQLSAATTGNYAFLFTQTIHTDVCVRVLVCLSICVSVCLYLSLSVCVCVWAFVC